MATSLREKKRERLFGTLLRERERYRKRLFGTLLREIERQSWIREIPVTCII